MNPRSLGLITTAHGPGSHVSWIADDTIELRTDGSDASAGDTTCELRLQHALDSKPSDEHELTHLWLPHLTPEEGHVMADAILRSPAIVLADGRLALVLLVDLDDVKDALRAGWRVWLDYDHPRKTITLALGAYREEGHVFYRRAPSANGAKARLRLHVLASAAPEDLQDPFQMATKWLWQRYGRPAFDAAPRVSIATLSDYVVRWAFSEEGWGESVWQPIALPNAPDAAAPVFIVDVTRHPSVPLAKRTWREPRSVWNQAWFSTQRCANGLLRFARQRGSRDLHLGRRDSPSESSRDLEERARKMTEVALAAPQTDGLFPSVLIAADDEVPARTWRWIHSNRRPAAAGDQACHIVDAAFTCRMLLEWSELTGDVRATGYVKRFADRLVRLAAKSEHAAFPGWVEPDGTIPAALAYGPESAMSTALLFELGAGYEATALASLPFLERVVEDARWEDFETYYSCAPWGATDQLGRRVARNGIYKQNTLSIAWCADAFFRAWRTTGDAKHLALARRCLDELSLYQAVWNPPWLPAPAIGGFGVMNADCEWNDARQSLFAPLYLELGQAMNDDELIERGISAVRASFSMLYCPENKALRAAYEKTHPFFGPESYGFMMENQGHSGIDNPIGTFTIFTWGNGSALATAATVRDRFPDLALRHGLVG